MSADPRIAAACEQFRKDYQAVRAEIEKSIVGHGEIIDGILTCLFVAGHVLLEGVPGLGKTLLVRAAAAALDLKFNRIQFTPDLMPADITGTHILNETAEGRRGFSFLPGPVFSQIVLADEINRATPKTQSALLEAMQERQVTAGGEIRKLPAPFFVLATQNPLELEGTYPLPEAQIDRFFFKLLVRYSNAEEMKAILERTCGDTEPVIKAVLDGQRILEHQRLVRSVVAAPHVQEWIVRLVMATQPGNEFGGDEAKKYIRMGASPRAAQAILLAGKVRAMLEGRLHVAVEDCKAVALAALRHRVILNFSAEAEGVSADEVLGRIMNEEARRHEGT